MFGSVLLPVGEMIGDEEDELHTDSDSDDEDTGHVSRLLPHGRSEFRVSEHTRRNGAAEHEGNLMRKGSYKPSKSDIFSKGIPIGERQRRSTTTELERMQLSPQQQQQTHLNGTLGSSSDEEMKEI